MLLPALIFIGFMNWLIEFVGEPEKTHRTKVIHTSKVNRKDYVTLLPAFSKEEPLEVTHP
jgi:hypothetical protein